MTPQATGLLQHLKSYKRISPPSDVENTYLLENSLLPNPLSNSRLPFHMLMQTKHYWKIICKSATAGRLKFSSLTLLVSSLSASKDFCEALAFLI